MPENAPAVDDQIAVADMLHRINHKIRHVARRSADRGAVTFSQIRALRQLRQCGEPIRMSELADRLGIARRSATGVVDDLESTGLVERLADPNDRRVTLVAITKAGQKVLDRSLKRRRAAAATVLDPLDEVQLRQLRQLLAELVDSEH